MSARESLAYLKPVTGEPTGLGPASALTTPYEPPCSPPGTSMVPGHEPRLAPGVRGYAFRDGARIMIPIVIAERPGSGDVGRFLDALSPRCVFPVVISPVLRGMLRRRRWRMMLEMLDGELNDVWVKAGRA